MAAANQLLRKQELEPNQLTEQLNQLSPEIQYDIIRSEITEIISSTS